MASELRPVVRALRLRREPGRLAGLGVSSGRFGELSVTAAALGIGPAAAASLRRLLEARPAGYVVMAGVAGGVAPDLEVGEVVVPELVVEAGSDRRFVPHPVPGTGARGTLLTGATLLHGPDQLAALRSRQVQAVDMETSAVARVCEDRALPWSVVRTISDRLADGLVDETVLGLTRPDGRADPWAGLRLVLAHPSEMARLARLGRGTGRALRSLARAVPEVLAGISEPG